VVERVVEDVLERVAVLLLGIDHSRPEALAEDVMLAAVACVEGLRVLPVQVAHPVGQVRLRRLDEQVVMVAQQAPDVEAPAVAAHNAPQDLDEGKAIVCVAEDRGVVVPLRADVVVSAGGEVTVWPSHAADGSAGRARKRARAAVWRNVATVPSRARQRTGLGRPRPPSQTNIAT
jgi:hypothetical protein